MTLKELLNAKKSGKSFLHLRRYCTVCGTELRIYERKNYDGPLLFACDQCVKFYQIQYAMVEYKEVDKNDYKENFC